MTPIVTFEKADSIMTVPASEHVILDIAVSDGSRDLEQAGIAPAHRTGRQIPPKPASADSPVVRSFHASSNTATTGSTSRHHRSSGSRSRPRIAARASVSSGSSIT